MGSVGLRSARTWLARHWLGLVCVVALSLLIVNEALRGWHPVQDWDWLLNTGVIVFLGALVIARDIPQQARLTVSRLKVYSTRHGESVEDLNALIVARLKARGRLYALCGAPLAFAAMAVIWEWALRYTSA